MSKQLSERTKVVVRNLPPTLAADAFQSTIDKHVEGSYDWWTYYPGKVSLKRTVFSRAFINFNNPDAVINFKNKFDGHVFVSTRGSQYKCTVEYAMFQKVPTPSAKKLAMEGTIEKDSDFQAFIKALDEGPKAVPTAQAQLEAQQAARSGEESGPVVTSLMAYLQKKYESTPFTGRRGSRVARRKEGANLTSLLEEEDDLNKLARSRGRSGRSSSTAAGDTADTTAAAVAAATAAASQAAAHADKRGKQKHSKHTSKQQQEGLQAESSTAKGGKQGRAGREAGSGAVESTPSRADRHIKQVASAAEDDKSNRPANSAAATGSEDDDKTKQAAAAALAAASAANAAAAARKSRVKAGHQVYTPGARAGGRLFAAALPKTASSATATSSDATVSTCAEGSSVPAAQPGGSSVVQDQALATAASNSKKGAQPGRKATAAAAPPPVAPAVGIYAGDAPASSASAGSSKAAGAATSADSSAASPSSKAARGGRGRGRSGAAGRQQQPSQQQQKWLPKPKGGGAG